MILRPTHAVVRLAALDLRRSPDHCSELRSQLLMGEAVRVLSGSRDRRWWRVRNLADGYAGWVRTWGLVGASARRAAAWSRRARARLAASHAEVRARRRGGPLVSPLFWNARVIGGRRVGAMRAVELPDGRRGWVPAGALASIRPRRRMIDRVRSLLGVPYLWGGRTPMGLDCSAFTQLVLAEQGMKLPRDSNQQFRATRALGDGEPARSGDLVFFGPVRGRLGHVGLMLGGGYYAHARGEVRINSVDPLNKLWDHELGGQMRGFRRPV